MKKFYSFFLVLGVLTGSAAAGDNLVPNGGFENGLDPWGLHVCQARAKGAIDSNIYHTGKHSFRMTNVSKSAPNVFVRVYQKIKGLKPNTAYRIVTWCKGTAVDGAWIGGGQGWQIRESLPQGDFDWFRVSLEWITGPKETEFDLMITVEGPTKSLWIDDVEMTEVKDDPTEKAKIASGLKEVAARYEKINQSVNDHPNLKADACVTLGLEVARRFILRLENKELVGKQSIKWSARQVGEVREVLDRTQIEIAEILQGKRIIEPAAPSFYSGGYVGWDAMKDFPCFKKIGTALYQTERGPAEVLPDGTLDPAGQTFVRDTLTAAQANGVKVDLILSPHWFPEWAYKESPDLTNIRRFGFIKYNIDHPRARAVIQKWLELFIPRVKDHPALNSFCLSNEPMYVNSGRDPYSRPLWPEYLKRRHGKIEVLNALYGKTFKSFQEVPIPGFEMPEKLSDRRAFYDWVRFNQDHFADWHRWMNRIVKEKAPNIPTHSKVMAHYFLPDMVMSGIDPELICDITDLAGNDAYAYVTPQGPYAYNWVHEEIWYDLLHSFRNQPVFNSENHTIQDGFEGPVPSANTYAVLWQGAIHHQRATTLWVWCEAESGELRGSLYFRPANIYAAGKAMLDLNRLQPQVLALSGAKPRAALLATMNSTFWEKDYGETVKNVYTALTFMGRPATFVTERQLASGKFAEVDWIILPRATHVTSSTVEALRGYMKRGGKLLMVGPENLEWDEYHRRRILPAEFRGAAHIDSTAGALRQVLVKSGLNIVDLRETDTGKPALGIEYRVVPYKEIHLVNLINFLPKTQTVTLDLAGRAVDLISGNPVDLKKITLAPMVPQLLEVKP
jgi:hypothetical protein